MSLTSYQREICRLIATNRRRSGESYVAGGLALNAVLGAQRISRDIDLFHDSDEALRRSFSEDRDVFTASGHQAQIVRETPAFVEAIVSRGQGERVVIQWVRDSAYRFFPLLDDETFGLVLHPFDLATNKVLALVGRLEPRDWIDVIESHDRLQPLGYLFWAACGKDPGFGPGSLLCEARRSGRYSQAELDELAFEGERPDAGALARRWHEILAQAEQTIEALPGAEVGKAVLTTEGDLYRGSPASLVADLSTGRLVFHAGRIRGVWPSLKAAGP